jgi:hypothetical protein
MDDGSFVEAHGKFVGLVPSGWNDQVVGSRCTRGALARNTKDVAPHVHHGQEIVATVRIGPGADTTTGSSVRSKKVSE